MTATITQSSLPKISKNVYIGGALVDIREFTRGEPFRIVNSEVVDNAVLRLTLDEQGHAIIISAYNVEVKP